MVINLITYLDKFVLKSAQSKLSEIRDGSGAKRRLQLCTEKKRKKKKKNM